jgi:MFS superfamily sulfate permease-like transporter
VAVLGVITVGILPGLGIAVVLSLLRFIWGASRLSLWRLGPVPGKDHTYEVIGRSSVSISVPGLEILRLDGPLFFANILRFRDEVRRLLSGSPPPNAILLNLHANFGIDLSATDTLLGLVVEAEKTNTEILFAELQNPVHQMLRRCGLLDRIGENHVFLTVDDAVQDYLKRHATCYAGVEGGVPSALGEA